MRRVILCLLSSFLILGSLACADDAPDKPEPPVRLKKKNRPANEDAGKIVPPAAEEKKPEPKEPAKAGEPKKEAEPEPQDPEQDEKETLERLSRNLRTAEERLANKEVGDGTRQVQRDILKDLDALIELSQRPPQDQDQKQQDAESAASDSKPSAGKQQQQGSRGQRQQQARGNRRGSRSQNAKGKTRDRASSLRTRWPRVGRGRSPVRATAARRGKTSSPTCIKKSGATCPNRSARR